MARAAVAFSSVVPHVHGRLISPTLSVRLLAPFVRACRHAGVDAGALLLSHGISRRDLEEERRIPHSVAVELLEAAITATGDPFLPLHAAERTRPGDLDALEYAARSSRNLKEAITRVNLYVRLLHDAVGVPLRVSGDVAIWTIDLAVAAPRIAEYEYAIALVLATARSITKLNVRPLEVHFPGPHPTDTSEHVRVLSDVIRWNASAAAMVFPASALDWTLPNPNPRLAAALAEHAERLLSELQSAKQVTRRVREHIAIQLPIGNVTIETVADKLKTSARTLRRKLMSERTTFSEELDDVRRELALGYLASNERSITEISYLLGFSNQGAFHRAFKRWTGRTPSEHRLEKRQQPPLRSSTGVHKRFAD